MSCVSLPNVAPVMPMTRMIVVVVVVIVIVMKAYMAMSA